jgi:SAM-dependent methyltransferase
METFHEMRPTEISKGYDEKYGSSNYFGYRVWLYRPFVEALVARVGLRPGGHLLDAGCGQGFFTWLFAERGLNAVGVDVSAAGVSSARDIYSSSGAKFEIGDILKLGWRKQFDCVFTRSCSLYNSQEFETKHGVTDRLLSYLRPNGILIFDYYSKPCATAPTKSQQWIYHSLESVQNHFSRYPGAEVYFSLRIETMLLGRLAFSRQVSRACAWLSYRMGVGGELIAFVRKPVQ